MYRFVACNLVGWLQQVVYHPFYFYIVWQMGTALSSGFYFLLMFGFELWGKLIIMELTICLRGVIDCAE